MSEKARTSLGRLEISAMFISRMTAYIVVLLSLLAEGFFVAAWFRDANRPEVRLAVLVWPFCIIPLAAAIRSNSPQGRLDRLGREMLRKRWSAEYGDGHSGDHAALADEIDAGFGFFYLLVAPVLAVWLGYCLWKA